MNEWIALELATLGTSRGVRSAARPRARTPGEATGVLGCGDASRPAGARPPRHRRTGASARHAEVSRVVSRRVRVLPDGAALPGHRAPAQGRDPRPRAGLRATTCRGTRSTSRCSTSRPRAATRRSIASSSSASSSAARGDVVARYNWLINPGMPDPGRGHRHPRHHRRDGEGQAALRGDRRRDRRRRSQGCVPAAYNALFDRAFMMSEFARARSADAAGSPPAARSRARSSGSIRSSGRATSRHDEKSRALGDVAARLGVQARERAPRRATTPRPRSASSTPSAATRGSRAPTARCVQEQRRLSQKQADAAPHAGEADADRATLRLHLDARRPTRGATSSNASDAARLPIGSVAEEAPP